jgi:hypothetical protein
MRVAYDTVVYATCAPAASLQMQQPQQEELHLLKHQK